MVLALEIANRGWSPAPASTLRVFQTSKPDFDNTAVEIKVSKKVGKKIKQVPLDLPVPALAIEQTHRISVSAKISKAAYTALLNKRLAVYLDFPKQIPEAYEDNNTPVSDVITGP